MHRVWRSILRLEREVLRQFWLSAPVGPRTECCAGSQRTGAVPRLWNPTSSCCPSDRRHHHLCQLNQTYHYHWTNYHHTKPCFGRDRVSEDGATVCAGDCHGPDFRFHGRFDHPGDAVPQEQLMLFRSEGGQVGRFRKETTRDASRRCGRAGKITEA